MLQNPELSIPAVATSTAIERFLKFIQRRFQWLAARETLPHELAIFYQNEFPSDHLERAYDRRIANESFCPSVRGLY